jgi:hypothetical protein
MEGQYKNELFRLSFKKMKAVGLPPDIMINPMLP